MKRWMTGPMVTLAICAAAVSTGCSSNKKKLENASTPPSSPYPAMNQASLDVPSTPPTAPPASYTPPPQPVVYDPPAPADQPVIVDSYADASSGGGYAPTAAPYRAPIRRASASGTRYTVRKGESLWSIAQARYGNGNRWKSIAAANPTIDPNRIQAGQTIVLP